MPKPLPPQFPGGMRPAEYEMLGELLARFAPKRTLEIGMANGGSTVVLCGYHAKAGAGGRHTAVDPYQSSPPPQGVGGAGIAAVHAAGHADFLIVIEEPDYLVLPRFVDEKAKFDLVLIDGYHSFDYTFVDYFYADLLLPVGGVMIFHDTNWASVEKVCRFVEACKPYERLSPRTAVKQHTRIGKIGRWIRQLLSGQLAEARDRRTRWFTLAAYRKIADSLVHEKDFQAF